MRRHLLRTSLYPVVSWWKHPITVRVPIGTPLEKVVALAGGVTLQKMQFTSLVDL